MDNEYKCPLVNSVIDETICYDIQMVIGPGSLINKRILEDYNDEFDVGRVTDELAATACPACPFNQLRQRAAQKGSEETLLNMACSNDLHIAL